MNEITAKLKGIEETGKVMGEYPVLILTFEGLGDEKVYAANDKLVMMKFLDKEVVFSVREELFEGTYVNMLETFTAIASINVVDQDATAKLYLLEKAPNQCTVAFSDIALGDNVLSVILYCTSVTYGRNNRTTWADLTLVDRDHKVANVRKFNPERMDYEYQDRYVKLDMYRNDYGLNTEEPELLDELGNYDNPEKDICKAYLNRVIHEDPDLEGFVQRSSLFEKMYEYSYAENLDKGHELVRLGRLVYLIDQLRNLTGSLDIQALIRAAICSRAYVLCNREEMNWSLLKQNIVMMSKYQFNPSGITADLVDYDSTSNIPERDVLKNLTEVSKTISIASMTDTYKKELKREVPNRYSH